MPGDDRNKFYISQVFLVFVYIYMVLYLSKYTVLYLSIYIQYCTVLRVHLQKQFYPLTNCAHSGISIKL